jgi:hypothetical protein
MHIVSLLPHSTELIRDGRIVLRIPPSGVTARVEVVSEEVEELRCGGMVLPVIQTRYGQVTGLPEPRPGTFYLVSGLVLDYAKDRVDLLVPARVLRSKGRVLGCQAFARGSVRVDVS